MKQSMVNNKQTLLHGGKLFVDTSWFKAFVDIKDDFYTKASDQFSKIESEKILLVTTNFILDESYTLIRKRVSKAESFKFKELLSELTGILSLVRVAPKDENDAWSYFKEDWSDLSFTDCTSFAVMKRLGLKNVATFDNHFARAGFTIFK